MAVGARTPTSATPALLLLLIPPAGSGQATWPARTPLLPPPPPPPLPSCGSTTLRDSALNLTEVAWQPEQGGVYIGAPSLVRLPGSGHVLVSSNLFGSGVDFSDPRTGVALHRSTSAGASFSPVQLPAPGVLNHCDSTLFILGTSVYLLGPACRGDVVRLSRSLDGVRWPAAGQRAVITATPGWSFANAPTTVVQSAGRIWRAVETVTKASNTAWGSSVIIYATIPPDDPTGAALLTAAWRSSTPLPFARDWPAAAWPPARWGGEWGAKGSLEGGAVPGPTASANSSTIDMYVVLRLDLLSTSVSPAHAILLRFDAARNALQFEQVLDFPGGHSKFPIRFDSRTRLYLALVNNVTASPEEWLTSETARLARNRLALSVSSDLREWTVVAPLLWDDTGFQREDSYRFTGFQYADFHLDGEDEEDLIVVVRTAYRGANTFHNSNRITYKRIVGWRTLLRGLRKLEVGGALGVATLQPARFSSDTLEYSAMVPADAAAVEVRATGFGDDASPASPVRQTISAGFVGGQTVPIRGSVASVPLPPGTDSAVLRVSVVGEQGESSCGAALRASCGATRASVFDCAHCAGAHQRQLLRHGCTNDLIAAFCSSLFDAGVGAAETNYTVTIRRARPIASVTGVGFELRTVGAAGDNIAWRDRKWSYSELPPALVGLRYTMLTCLERGGSCGALAHPAVAINASVHTAGVLFAVTPVFVGCESASCAKFEATQKVFAAAGWHLCNMSASMAVGAGGQAAETTALVVLRKVVRAGGAVQVPRSTGFMIALFVP